MPLVEKAGLESALVAYFGEGRGLKEPVSRSYSHPISGKCCIDKRFH